MKKLIENIANWYKADKNKKFYDRLWFYLVIIIVVMGSQLLLGYIPIAK